MHCNDCSVSLVFNSVSWGPEVDRHGGRVAYKNWFNTSCKFSCTVYGHTILTNDWSTFQMLVSTPQHTRTQTQQNVFDDWMDIPLPSSELDELQAQISTCSYLPHQRPGISTPRRSAESIQEYPETSTYVCAPLLSSEPASSPSVPVEIPMDTLLKLKNESNSRRNFAFKQAEKNVHLQWEAYLKLSRKTRKETARQEATWGHQKEHLKALALRKQGRLSWSLAWLP